MSHSPLELLRHILEEVDYLTKTAKDLVKEDFLSDETLKRSFVRSIEIIGEASKKIAPQIRAKYDDIEWRKISGMRNRLIHDYFAVDYDIVWDVVVPPDAGGKPAMLTPRRVDVGGNAMSPDFWGSQAQVDGFRAVLVAVDEEGSGRVRRSARARAWRGRARPGGTPALTA